ncbi:MAG: prolyl oligopeptidase family serine peptidase [Treponema sp.]|nr:prolyl oligopeptidase family serine peptidase [Treponema sp.]
MKHFIVSLTLALCAAGLFALDARDFQAYENSLSAKKGLPDLKLVESASPASGEYVMFINVYDWGPAVDKVVLNVGKKVRDSKLSATAFDVDIVISTSSGKADDGRGLIKGSRKVTKAYLTDKNGKAGEKDSQYVCLELESGPDISACNPFLQLPVTAKFDQAYGMRIENEKLGISITKRTAIVSPQAAKFTLSSYIYENGDDDIELGSLSWLPDKRGSKPLLVWLHGTDDSAATNPYMPVLSCKSAQLTGDDIQKHFPNGAAVLIPQCPGSWLESTTVDKYGFRIWIPAEIGETIHRITEPIWRFMHDIFSSSEANMDDSKTAKASYYTEALKAMIDDFVRKNPEIDRERICIMGAGSGGYMAVNMCVEYPDFFAAAVPVSEEYPDSKLTDAEIANLAQMPLWFVYSTEDKTVDSSEFSAATIKRLKDEKPAELRQSVYKEISVKAESGKKAKYDAHECWIPLFRDECADGRTKLFDWLAKQTLGRRELLDTGRDADSVSDDDADVSVPDEDKGSGSKRDRGRNKDDRKDKDTPSPKDDDDWNISDTPPVIL